MNIIWGEIMETLSLYLIYFQTILLLILILNTNRVRIGSEDIQGSNWCVSRFSKHGICNLFLVK